MSEYSITVNRTCARCPRVEKTEVSVDDIVKMSSASKGGIPNGPKAIRVEIDESRAVEFPFLCAPCRRIVARYVELIAKKPKHQSPVRGEHQIEVEEE